MTNILDSALGLAALGLPVFPLRSIDKRPACEHGHHEATTDADTIARLFANPLAGLIGVPAGEVSGFDAIDVDLARGGGEWLAENEHRLPKTRRHHSRSGGVHLLLQHSPGMRTKFDRIAPGVEVRGEGGYIAWWPAHGCHAEGDTWAPWPDWLLIAAMRGGRPAGSAAPAPTDLAPPSAADLVALLSAMPNPEPTTRGDYVSLNLAVAGCIRALESLGRCDQDEMDDIRDAAAEWCARWDSGRAADAETERARWESDWGVRTNDVSGWRHVLALADRFGLDTSPQHHAAAVSEFGALPLPPEIAAATQRRIVRVRPDNLTQQINESESALLSAGCGLYDHAGTVVRVGEVKERTKTGADRRVVRRIEVTETHLRELIGRHVDFVRWDAREKAEVPTRCPPDVPAGYLARRSLEWNLPRLAGIVTAPTLRADATVLQSPGYDDATGLLFDPHGETFPPVSESPAQDDARAALALLRGLFAEFPFVDDGSRSVALSAVLTALVRRSLSAAPLHAFTAPAPGTGKSYAVDLVSLIATGQAASGFDYSADEPENRKQIDAALLTGASVMVLDNVDAELKGARLNQILTQERVNVRILGQSRNVDVACDAFVMANGNNLAIAADMTRRVVLCRMDAEIERPETRQFRQDPMALVQAERGRYVTAALTILRAYHVADRPGQPPALGSFGAWSSLIRGALVWLGEADPATTSDAVRENDPRRADLLAVVEQWSRVIGGHNVTAHELIEEANREPEFRDALLVVAGIAGTLNSRRLGQWLRANKAKVINGLKLLPDVARVGIGTWRLHGLPAAATISLAAVRARRAAASATADNLAAFT